MKRVFLACTFVLILLCLLSCGKDESDKVVGMWEDKITRQIVSFTKDGYYYEGINENFTSDKTKYKVTDEEIIYYLENQPETEFSVKYHFDKDGNLVVNNSIVYKKVQIPDEFTESAEK